MARLILDGTAWILAAESTLGRSPESWLVLSSGLVSNTHAQVVFQSGRWLLRDLNSRNGTWVDGRRLGRVPHELQPGQRIVLGGTGGVTLEVEDTASPEPIAVSTTPPNTRVVGEDGVLEIGEVIIERCDDRWCMNGEPLGDRITIPADGENWRLHLPVEVPRTVEMIDQSAARFIIRHSADVEFFQLALQMGDAPVQELGTRTYAYLLYVLASTRCANLADGVEEAEAGWMDVEDLLEELEQDDPRSATRPRVNVHVRRFRTMLMDNGLMGQIGPRIERRGSEAIRLAGTVAVMPIG